MWHACGENVNTHRVLVERLKERQEKKEPTDDTHKYRWFFLLLH